MNYLTRRLLTFPPVMLGVSILVFVAIRMVPVIPLRLCLERKQGC